MNDLYVFYDDNSSFLDFSFEAREFTKDTFSATVIAGEDAIYLGLYKPFNSAYIDMSTANANGGIFRVKYYNGSGFVDTENQFDDTTTLNRSGFVRWDKSDDWEASTVNSQEAFWIQITISGDTTALTFNGINIVYSDDTDLAKEMRSIDRFLSSGDSSFIAYHEAARDEIVQTTRNKGTAKKRDDEDFYRNFGKWDFLNIDEIRQASKYLALSKIMHDASDNPEDKYYQRYKDYLAAYGQAFNTWFISLDTDDDGEADKSEKLTANTIKLNRI